MGLLSTALWFWDAGAETGVLMDQEVQSRRYALDGSAITQGDTMSEQKVALVTGSSRGIGAAIIDTLAESGFAIPITWAVQL